MKYLNAKSVLPEAMLEQLRQYAEGQVLYVPKRPQNCKQWGEVQGTKRKTRERNKTIRAANVQGTPFCELAKEYCLTEETIKKSCTANYKEEPCL